MSAHLEPIGHTVCPVEPTIEIVKLYPGESVQALFFAVYNTGEESPKHTPAHAFHRSKDSRVELVIKAHGNQDALQLAKHALETTRLAFKINQ